MKTRNYYLLAVVAIVAGLNLFLSVNGQSLVADLKLLTVEAVANGEVNYNAPPDQWYITYGCAIEIKEIDAFTPEGPIVTTKYYSGAMGQCLDGHQRCTPHGCIKLSNGTY